MNSDAERKMYWFYISLYFFFRSSTSSLSQIFKMKCSERLSCVQAYEWDYRRYYLSISPRVLLKNRDGIYNK